MKLLIWQFTGRWAEDKNSLSLPGAEVRPAFIQLHIDWATSDPRQLHVYLSVLHSNIMISDKSELYVTDRELTFIQDTTWASDDLGGCFTALSSVKTS
jgi:hypothetical protein